MNPHPDKAILEVLLPYIRVYQALASVHGINDIFQDNGGKLLQLLMTTGLKNTPGREGSDAEDDDGKEYEIKSVNLATSARSFTTHHHMNQAIIDHYRSVDWIFGVYEGIELQHIYHLTPADLETYFQLWEERLREGREHLNNPKIPLNWVIETGVRIFRSGSSRLSKEFQDELLSALRDKHRELLDRPSLEQTSK